MECVPWTRTQQKVTDNTGKPHIVSRSGAMIIVFAACLFVMRDCDGWRGLTLPYVWQLVKAASEEERKKIMLQVTQLCPIEMVNTLFSEGGGTIFIEVSWRN
jgi:hypothetical protein